MKLKKWNGSAWVQDYPEVNVSSIVATGTPSSTTFLRGDGQWVTPGGGERKFYSSITGSSGQWYDLFTIADGSTGALFVSIQTYAHDDLLFAVGTGYSGSNVNTITILNCVYNPSGPYASITGVRVTNTGLVQAQFTWSSGPTVDIDVAVYGSGTLPTLASSLTFNANSYTIDDTVSITGLQGKIRSESGFVQGSTPIPSGTGTSNELTYWSGTNTIGTLATATYPSLTELSYVKGVSSALQTQLNGKASTSHTHTIGFFSSAISSNLDTLYSTGQFGFANTTTGRPEDYGQGINIVNNGTAHNSTDNWITQLAFGTAGSTSYFRTKVNTGAWTAWRKIWNEANDGTGSGLDADFLDGQHGSYFLDTSGSTQTKSGNLTVSATLSGGTMSSRNYSLNANGVPTSNLGTPTIVEMALFQEQFDNKTAFANINRLSAETSTDGSTWTSFTLTDAQKRGLLGGDFGTAINIPYNTAYFRFKLLPGDYVYANALYCYWSSQGHTTAVQIYKKHDSGSYTQHTSSTSQVSAWPGHLYLPFSTIPWLDNGTLGTHFDEIYVVFIPTWNATYSANSIQINKLQIWGGYPASKRNVYTTDDSQNVTFPANLTGTRLFSTIANGTSPLSVTSTTVNTNLNADLLDGYHETSFIRLAANSSSATNGNFAIGNASSRNFIQTHSGQPLDINPLGNSVAFDTNTLFVDATNNRVGVGTSSPSYTFHVKTTDTSTTIGANIVGRFETNASNADVSLQLSDGVSSASQISHTAGALHLRTANTTRLSVLSDGKVGIGTTTPDTILHAYRNTADSVGLLKVTNQAQSSTGKLASFVTNISASLVEVFTIAQTGLTGINQATPTAQLEVKSGATDRVPLIVDTLASHTADLQQWKINNANISRVDSSGYFAGVGMYHITSANNALIVTDSSGTSIRRNIADTNPALIVNLANASATGNIQVWQHAGNQKVSIDKDGGISAVNLTLSGDLTVNGTTTNINTTNLVVEDKNIILGDVTTPSDTTADGGGITLKGASDKTITWVDSTDHWTSNQVFSAPNFVSTVATGTAPYSATSTTVNTNLNADLLDGYHASSFVLGSSMINYAPLASPTFTGTPTAPTATAGTNTTQIATTQFVTSAVTGNINLGSNSITATRLKITADGTQPNWEIFESSNKLSVQAIDGSTNPIYDIWHSGNDGASSGLDADLLDGNHASAFALASHTHTKSQITDFAHTHVKADITDFSHSHGNISNSGGWNNSPNTPANGDTIPLTRSGLISNSNLTIGTGTTTFLRNDGTWATPAGTGVSGSGTANELTYWTGASSIGTLSTATYPSLTELSYVKGVTSAIQTQLNREITKYRSTQQSSTSGNTNTTAVTSITLLANKYYHLDVTGMYSKTSTSGSTAPVITIAVDNATGTPTINGRFEWLNGSAATAYTVSNTNGAITTSATARGFTAATATLSAITTTPWGLKALFYTGTSDKVLTFYIAHSSSVSGTVAVDNISIHATEVLA